jgi:phage baseplate assembly protein W
VLGTDSTNGKALAGLDHLRQSIRDILTTPLGSRVMLRDYGSRLFDLVDAPLNQGTIMELYAATIEALVKWEPRIAVSAVQILSVISGTVTLTITGTYLPEGKPITLDGIVI